MPFIGDHEGAARSAIIKNSAQEVSECPDIAARGAAAESSREGAISSTA
jgi:hypothetical protein